MIAKRDIAEKDLDWLERRDAAYVLRQAKACPGISKKMLMTSGESRNERTKFERINELIDAGLMVYEKEGNKRYNAGTIRLTPRGERIVGHLNAIDELMKEQPVETMPAGEAAMNGIFAGKRQMTEDVMDLFVKSLRDKRSAELELKILTKAVLRRNGLEYTGNPRVEDLITAKDVAGRVFGLSDEEWSRIRTKKEEELKAISGRPANAEELYDQYVKNSQARMVLPCTRRYFMSLLKAGMDPESVLEEGFTIDDVPAEIREKARTEKK